MAMPRQKAVMREGKELTLATKAFAEESPRQSWWALLSTISLLLLSLAGSFSLRGIVPQIACSLVASLLIVRLFVLYHDHQHGAILKHSALADGFFRLFGILVLSPSRI